jgi:hypothetical protein
MGPPCPVGRLSLKRGVLAVAGDEPRLRGERSCSLSPARPGRSMTRPGSKGCRGRSSRSPSLGRPLSKLGRSRSRSRSRSLSLSLSLSRSRSQSLGLRSSLRLPQSYGRRGNPAGSLSRQFDISYRGTHASVVVPVGTSHLSVIRLSTEPRTFSAAGKP